VILIGGRWEVTMNETAEAIKNRIASRDYRVAIVGLGYVGLPLALAFVRKGFTTLGVDIDPRKASMLRQGESYLRHIDVDEVPRAIERGLFDATEDFERLREADAILLCVPTPVDHHQQPDMRFVRKTVRAVRDRLRPGQLVVLESTTYPGTTDELVKDTLEETGLRAGVDFFLAYSPEREDPGNPDFATSTIPKLVGGFDDVSGALAEELYTAVIANVVRVGNARIAEAAKLTENIFRAVNIALVNELKVTFDQMGLDVWEVLDAAATKPFGFMRFNPGPGWGGHCIPVDPFYLSWKARQYGIAPKFIELAGEINIRMHEYVVNKLAAGLNGHAKSVKGAMVLLLGVAYKKDVDDCRESPAFPIMDQLERLGATLLYHDPYVAEIPRMREWPAFRGRTSTPLDDELLGSVDAVLIVTDHSGVDYDRVLARSKLVIDTRGVCGRPADNLVKA
jgi:UDP-N-acetyl-D-glucosamine dehydrogenase